MLEDDWDEAENVISNAALLAATSAFAKEAEGEMNLCLEEVEDRKLQKLLVNSMEKHDVTIVIDDN